jgi:hypothetical protein
MILMTAERNLCLVLINAWHFEKVKRKYGFSSNLYFFTSFSTKAFARGGDFANYFDRPTPFD